MCSKTTTKSLVQNCQSVQTRRRVEMPKMQCSRLTECKIILWKVRKTGLASTDEIEVGRAPATSMVPCDELNPWKRGGWTELSDTPNAEQGRPAQEWFAWCEWGFGVISWRGWSLWRSSGFSRMRGRLSFASTMETLRRGVSIANSDCFQARPLGKLTWTLATLAHHVHIDEEGWVPLANSD